MFHNFIVFCRGAESVRDLRGVKVRSLITALEDLCCTSKEY